MSYLEIKHLRMLLAIAETGNMTQAAEKLFISQSALSQQLKSIEEKLKTDLFYRRRRKMILTPIGKKLIKPAKSVTEIMDWAELEIAEIVSGGSHDMKVGTQCVFCYKWLPGVMRTLQERFPNVEVEIGTSVDLVKELEKGKFDFIITAASLEAEQILYQPLFSDQLVCVLPPDHLKCRHNHVQFEDFNESCFIAHTEKESSQVYQMLLKPKGIEPKQYLVVDQPQAAIEMVAAGFGISIFPKWAIKETLESGIIAVRPITARGVPLTWKAAYLKNGNITDFHQTFIQILSQMNRGG